MAALHICHLNPPRSESCYFSAQKYQNEASSFFRKDVNVVTSENVVEVVAFCTIVAMLNMRVSMLHHKPGAPFTVLPTLLAMRWGGI
jgi:hypothetical protein